jgi:DNA (cytosine-5)-methyltransferase 1
LTEYVSRPEGAELTKPRGKRQSGHEADTVGNKRGGVLQPTTLVQEFLSAPARDSEATVVDLFCGAGGLSHGFLLEGFVLAGGIDVDPDCRFPYEANNHARFIQSDVRNVSSADVVAMYSGRSPRVLAGCAPCQPFSSYSRGKSSSKDEKWGLLYAFQRLVAETQPDIVTMENVVRIQGHKVFRDFVATLNSLGYYVAITEVFCPDYGIPQTRRRLVVLASKYAPISLVPPTHSKEAYATVREAIGGLPPLSAGQADMTDELHRASHLSATNLRRIRSSVPGGTWKDWDPALRAKCHSKESGESYRDVYGRMEWDKPSPTITTECFGYGNGRFGHPTQDRAISLREAALLQTFPLAYQFVEPGRRVETSTAGRLIGNAVPVELARVIARSIRKHLEADIG